MTVVVLMIDLQITQATSVVWPATSFPSEKQSPPLPSSHRLGITSHAQKCNQIPATFSKVRKNRVI